MLFFLVFLTGFLLLRRYAEHYGGAAVQLLKVAWFVLAVVLEYWLLSGQPWVPKFLGGPEAVSLDILAWDEFEITLFYELQMGYHWHSLLYGFIEHAKTEMFVHHFVTVILISASQYFGYQRCGLIVYYLHDVPDIIGYIMKTVVRLQLKPLLVPSFVSLVFTWAYYRLYILALLINHFYHVISGELFGFRFVYPFIVMLSILWVLHLYWFVMFFQMVAIYVKKGKAVDTSVNDKAVNPYASSPRSSSEDATQAAPSQTHAKAD